MRFLFLLVCIMVGLAASESSLPRVLLIGDSISSGYGGTARSALAEQAVVIRAPGNASASSRAFQKPVLPKHWVDNEVGDDPENPENSDQLSEKASNKKKRSMPRNAQGVIPKPTDYATYLDYYLAHGPFDVIHFNWGLHDLKRGGIPVDDYIRNLTTAVERMQETGAILIFATTTPVPPVNKERREPAKVQAFNAAAIEALSAKGVFINDLYAVIEPQLGTTQLPNNVHFTREGYGILGKAVARSVADALAKRSDRE